jgi:hypothetical protein
LVLKTFEAISNESWQREVTRVKFSVEGRARSRPYDEGDANGRRPSTTGSGAELARKMRMPVFSGANLLGGLIFGSIGFVAFIYGKRMHIWKPMFIGLALMAYPYFVENDVAMFAIGVVGTAALFLFRE